MDCSPLQLADGSVPLSPDSLFARLDDLGVAHRTASHAPVFTVEEARRVRGAIPGVHSKNLFLRDKKERHWLVSCRSDRTVDLTWLAQELGTKRLTFCSRRRLTAYLGVRAGAVSPFAVANDHGRVVRVALDGDMLEADPLNFHPLDNSKTTSISTEGLLRFLAAEDHDPQIVRFPPDAIAATPGGSPAPSSADSLEHPA